MKYIYMTNYSVKGIKTLDQLVSLSFYKKTISKNPDTQEYNVKGIYGMNGSGKSAIVASVEIFKNLLMNPTYLSNPIVQENLNAIVNKMMNELSIAVDYMVAFGEKLLAFRYEVILSKDKSGKYVISGEQLAVKNAVSKSDNMKTIFKVSCGEIVYINGGVHDDLSRMLKEKTMNLLEEKTVTASFVEKILDTALKVQEMRQDSLLVSIFSLWLFAKRIHVYLDESDDHKNYLINGSLNYDHEEKNSQINSLMKYYLEMDSDNLEVISLTDNIVPIEGYGKFENIIKKLYEFLHIFKPDLQDIEIDKKVNHNLYSCDLIMVYDSYKIDVEFESTGLKKLIKLFAYLREMVQGGIVFIDEFDSNLHDVYLCALLEYLMEYGKGQLCFTTHNVGPMDILKQHKKSIDFLSADHKIYPWTSNGNYSPSKLYRNGMIEGSPFNVDSIDFISAFHTGKED